MPSPQLTIKSKAKDLYQNGSLTEAINELIQEVRNNPTDNWRRTFLFELLCFNGEWERAERQLKGLLVTGANAEIGLLVYGNNIKAEIARNRFFSSNVAPEFLLPPPNYIWLQLEAINKLQEKDYSQVRKLLDELEEKQPSLKGKINGKTFNHFTDYNDFFACCLEVFLQDKYFWVPFEHIESLETEPPKQLRDLIWAKAIIKLTNGTIAQVFLPALYPNSYKHENELVRLGRMTDWQALPNEIYLGYGLRTFLSDSKEKTIFEITNLTFDHSEKKGENMMSTVTQSLNPCIDFDKLLRPIEGNNPSGENLQYSGLHDEIREARRSEDVEEQGDWKREAKTADWHKVIDLSTNALETKTKDLQVAVWLSEALVKNYSFVGLRDSLQLLKRLIEGFWDTFYPEIEDGDLEARANAFSWFDRQTSVLIKQLPLTASNLTDNYSYLQYEESKSFDIPEKTDNLSSEELHHVNELKEQAAKEHKTTSEEWRKAQNITSIGFYQTNYNLLNECWQAYLELDHLMDKLFLSQTPGLGTLKKSLDDIRSLIEKIYKAKQPIAIPQTDNTSSNLIEHTEKSSPSEQPYATTVTNTGVIKSRDDALERLKAVAEYFHKTEPHSPVAFLVERAIKWGEMPLDQWLEEVIKSNEILGQVRETLGIKT